MRCNLYDFCTGLQKEVILYAYGSLCWRDDMLVGWYLPAGLGAGQVSDTLLADLPWPCLSCLVFAASVA